MTIDVAIQRLKELNQAVPKPMRLPTAVELARAEQILQTTFPSDYRRYLLEVSNVVFGTKEPCTILFDGSYTDLVDVTSAARQNGLPLDLLPICEDNGDYYCINSRSEVVFWSHNGTPDEKWTSLAEWIEDIWIRRK